VVRMLHRDGYRVLEADCGEAAMELLLDHPSVDLLITDGSMPGISGRELIDASRALRPDLPILMISGHLPDQGEEDIPYLPKPFTAAQLLGTVAEILRE
jgi:two-component system, cell cycle sensor histidine kinase and response regulator CckA